MKQVRSNSYRNAEEEMTTWFVFVKHFIEVPSLWLVQKDNLFSSFLEEMGLSVAEIAGSNQIRFSTMSRLEFLSFFLLYFSWRRSFPMEPIKWDRALSRHNSLRCTLAMKKPPKRLRHVYYFYDQYGSIF